MLEPIATALMVGIGSHCGDDQAGWRVAERLAERAPASVLVRLARTPSQLLDWLAGIDRLILCDACCAGAEPGAVRRWDWPAAELQSVRWSGAHDISLPAVLQLAHRLGRLPASVAIWCVEAGPIGAGDVMSDAVTAALPRVVESIERELRLPLQGAALQSNP